MRKTIVLPALCGILVAMDLPVANGWAEESQLSATSDSRSSEHNGATPSGKRVDTTSASASGERTEGRVYVHLER